MLWLRRCLRQRQRHDQEPFPPVWGCLPRTSPSPLTLPLSPLAGPVPAARRPSLQAAPAAVLEAAGAAQATSQPGPAGAGAAEGARRQCCHRQPTRRPAPPRSLPAASSYWHLFHCCYAVVAFPFGLTASPPSISHERTKLQSYPVLVVWDTLLACHSCGCGLSRAPSATRLNSNVKSTNTAHSHRRVILMHNSTVTREF